MPVTYAAAHFDPGQLMRKGGENIETEKEGRLERVCQTAGSEVLGNEGLLNLASDVSNERSEKAFDCRSGNKRL